MPNPLNKINNEVIIVTGLSGAGRSHAASVLEDLGWYVVDNLPPNMIVPLVEMMIKSGGNVHKIATVIDIRSRDYFSDFKDVLDNLTHDNIAFRIMYFNASDNELIKRYEKVRRPHPLQVNGGSILDAITAERSLLANIRKSADIEIDTTELSIHDLSREIIDKLGRGSRRKMQVHIMSFGFKYGLPIDAEFVVDMRWLPNPFWIPDLKDKTGLDDAVYNYVLKSKGAKQFLRSFVQTTKATIDGFLHENKSTLTVAFGCTGGRHRSVSMARGYAEILRKDGIKVSVTNRDLGKE